MNKSYFEAVENTAKNVIGVGFASWLVVLVLALSGAAADSKTLFFFFAGGSALLVGGLVTWGFAALKSKVKEQNE